GDFSRTPGADGGHGQTRPYQNPRALDEELQTERSLRQDRQTSPGIGSTCANPHANGGLLLCDLRMPDFQDYAVKVQKPGAVLAEATRVQGELIRDIIRMNSDNFLVFGPDETASNRWQNVFEVTNRRSTAHILPSDEHVAPNGRVFEVLSEHQCEGWLEGYL